MIRLTGQVLFKELVVIEIREIEDFPQDSLSDIRRTAAVVDDIMKNLLEFW